MENLDKPCLLDDCYRRASLHLASPKEWVRIPPSPLTTTNPTLRGFFNRLSIGVAYNLTMTTMNVQEFADRIYGLYPNSRQRQNDRGIRQPNLSRQLKLSILVTQKLLSI